MVFIGVTGGIGSGKSLVCRLFERKGIQIFYADERAKKISERDDVTQEIIRSFGKAILTSSGSIDRRKLAAIVFSEHEKLLLLNSILHPKVFSDFDLWKKNLTTKFNYALAEAALMFESSMYKKLDYTLSIVAEDSVRIQRVMERDGVDSDLVKSRMKHQLPAQELIEQSDFVMYNNGSETDLQTKVNFFHILFSSLTHHNKTA
jgi:dephospho-CoA kinase